MKFNINNYVNKKVGFWGLLTVRGCATQASENSQSVRNKSECINTLSNL